MPPAGYPHRYLIPMELLIEILRFIVSIALLFGCYHIYRAYRNSKLLLPEEVGAVSIYAEQAGGQFGDIHWTIPFVRVSCYRNFVAVNCWNCKFVLKIGHVQRIRKEGIVSDGVRIIHNRTDLPKKIIIWPRNISKLMDAIESSVGLSNKAVVQKKNKSVRFVRFGTRQPIGKHKER